MATGYRYTLFRKRIVKLDDFPSGAMYPIHAEVFDAVFVDDGNSYEVEPRLIARCYTRSYNELLQLLNAYSDGQLWVDAQNMSAAIEELSTQYERESRGEFGDVYDLNEDEY